MHIVNWHCLSQEATLRQLAANQQTGLSKRTARKRLLQYGPNKIKGKNKHSFLSILVSQFSDLMVATLLGATVISFFMGEVFDALVIALIVVLNACLGTFQEYKAEEALEALENYGPTKCVVIREGNTIEIDKEQVVPGDLLVLTPGVRVAADARLLTANSLQLDEAALTGESMPVSKEPSWVLDAGVPVSERENMVYSGTMVVRGNGNAVVVATGMSTEMGCIARLVSSAESQKTPLEIRLAFLGRVILLICLLICGAIAVMGIYRGYPLESVFLTAVSLAVAAIPEGLPAVVTLCLAIGVQRMARQGAVIRRLEAIETLGSVTVICADKTGTLTKNQMEIVDILLPEIAMGIEEPGRGVNDQDFRIREILKTALLASDARHTPVPGSAAGEDPTEQAIVEMAIQAGYDLAELDRNFPRVSQRGFTSERRMMSVKVNTNRGSLICVKGAPDMIIPVCRKQLIKGMPKILTGTEKDRWHKVIDGQAEQGMRILAVAVKTDGITAGPRKIGTHRTEAEYQETGMTLMGCLVMADPLREETLKAVGVCKVAGIRPVLITGDHLKTAESVARQLQILGPVEKGLTGTDIDSLSDGQLRSVLDQCNVFARVTPAHKLRIVRVLKTMGHVVAMTGDGVNDAPALKEAACGVAMGMSGTDVARESGSVILTDDNFATIVRAVKEGRGIYDNIRKFIRYLLSCNLGEVIIMALATMIGLPLPLSPVQLLWMNLVTDGLPALALSMEPSEEGVMRRPPRDPNESVFSSGLLRLIVWRGLYIGGISTVVFLSNLKSGGLELASTMAFATLVTVQLMSAFDCRWEERVSLTDSRMFSNPYLLLACIVSWLMLFVTVKIPAIGVLFGTVPLSTGQWFFVFCVALFPRIFQAVFSNEKKYKG